METDILIIGSGVSGLSYAIQLAQRNKDLKITILSKTEAEETNTKYAQGGVAAVMQTKTDSFEKHVRDTLIAGDGLCDQQVVDFVVKEGNTRINELINWGAQFDKKDNGE